MVDIEKEKAEIKRMEEAIKATSSPFLKRDYEKAIRRKRKRIQYESKK